MLRSLSELLRSVEATRLRRRFGLGGDGRLEALEAELQARAPWHPSALNQRARDALPETMLASPPGELRKCALRFQQGQLDEALRLARRSSRPWARVLSGDLELLVGRPSEAEVEYETALAAFGPLADILTRKGRAQLEGGRPEQAWGQATEALVTNPLLGMARQLLEDAASRSGVPVLVLPLRAPVQRREGRIESTRKLSPSASAAWSAWNRAASRPDADTLPPGSGPHAALLKAWRAQPPRAPRYGEHDNRELLTLLRWQESGLLAAYEWSTGLNPANAEDYRAERRRAESTLRRFWNEGVRA